MSLTKVEFIHSATSLLHETQYSCQSKTDVVLLCFKHCLYPIKQLPAFLSALQASNEDIRIARYIVTHKKQLLLAREGHPSASIPGHQHMTDSSILAAGRIFFNAQGEIVGLSNESEDFPTLALQSMLWPVLILHFMHVPLTTPFLVIPYADTQTGDVHLLHQFELTLTDRFNITSLLPESFCHNLIAANQHETTLIRKQKQNLHSHKYALNREVLFQRSPHRQPHYHEEVPVLPVECSC
jgi:hypothetical protein